MPASRGLWMMPIGNPGAALSFAIPWGCVKWSDIS